MFRKEDIVPGMLIYAYIENGNDYIMYHVTNSKRGLVGISEDKWYLLLNDINENFISTTGNVKIMKVYGLSTYCYSALSFDPFESDREVLWSRENEVDWKNIPKDTKVQVKFEKHDKWHNRYFNKYENGICYVYPSGSDSFTYDDEVILTKIDDLERIRLYKGDD